MSTDYWPWWVGGPLLALVAVGYPLLTRAPLGVSGALSRILRWRSEKPGGTEGGKGASVSPAAGCAGDPAPTSAGCGDVTALTGGQAATGPDRVANLAFLAAIALGGAVASWVGGGGWGQIGYASEFHRLFGGGARGWVVLFVGGILVGFGTRWSGGCTSGHGLSGCGRLQPASLVATAVFFGTAIAVSYLLEGLRS